MNRKGHRIKIAGYQTVTEEMMEDLMPGMAERVTERIVHNLAKDIRKEAVKQRVSLITPVNITNGRMQDDFVYGRLTYVGQGFGFTQPSFIHRDYSRTRNRKRRKRK